MNMNLAVATNLSTSCNMFYFKKMLVFSMPIIVNTLWFIQITYLSIFSVLTQKVILLTRVIV